MPQPDFEAAASPPLQLQRVTPPAQLDVMMLWDKAKDKLAATGQEYFLKPLNATNLKKHFSSGFPVLGMVDTTRNHLAAVLLITPNLNACNGGYVPQCIAELPREVFESDSAVLQCLAVDPDYERQGVMKELLRQSLLVSKESGLCRVFAKVADPNTASRALFESQDFAEIETRAPVKGIYQNQAYDAHYLAKTVCKIDASLDIGTLPLFNGGHAARVAPPARVIPFPAPERR